MCDTKSVQFDSSIDESKDCTPEQKESKKWKEYGKANAKNRINGRSPEEYFKPQSKHRGRVKRSSAVINRARTNRNQRRLNER